MAQKGLWNIAKKECWRIEEPCSKKTETCFKTPSYARRKLSQQLAAGGCGASRGGEEEAERGGRTRRKQQWEKRGGGSEVCEELSPTSEVERVGDSFGFLVCVPAVPPSVPVVTVPVSNVNVHVVCQVVFSGSDCEFVEPQTFSLATKRKVCFVESQEYMNIDETPVRAPRATRSKVTVPTPEQSPPLPPRVWKHHQTNL